MEVYCERDKGEVKQNKVVCSMREFQVIPVGNYCMLVDMQANCMFGLLHEGVWLRRMGLQIACWGRDSSDCWTIR